MRNPSVIRLIPFLLLLLSCRSSHQDFLRHLEKIKSQGGEQYPANYAIATYLSTTKVIEAEEALPLVLELISHGSYTEARYCIDNLMYNGIHSHDLLALRGLCYFNELQPELALADLRQAIAGEPGNAKIRTLLDQVTGNSVNELSPEEIISASAALIAQGKMEEADSNLDRILEKDPAFHRALYFKSLVMLHREQYDSALHYMRFAKSSEDMEEYARSIASIEMAISGEKQIASSPGSFQGYMQKSQGLASLGLFPAAQESLDVGLRVIPDNMNLLLAKALVWVQAGQQETAREYFRALELRGVAIDPALKERILQNKQ